MTWRARSASDRTDEWPFWYVTDDQPLDCNKTAEAFASVTGEKWPPCHQFLPRDLAEELAAKMAEMAARQREARAMEGRDG